MRNRELAGLPTKQQPSQDTVGGILETYAARGVFKGFSKTGDGSWRMLWHRNRYFDLKQTDGKLTLPEVLPQVPARSQMMKELRAFVQSFSADSVPEHKRIDAKKLRLRVIAKGGSAGIEASLADDEDWDYTIRKLIHVVHEIYLVFLYDGAYYDYLIETFDLDPDHMA